MADIVIPNTFTPLTVGESAKVNANFAEIATKYNSFAVRTDKVTAGDLLFVDALYDIGKPGATRPRDIELSRNLTVGGAVLSASSTDLTIRAGSGGILRLGANGTDNLLIVDNAGIIRTGGAVAASAALGDIVLPNTKAYRSANAATTDTFPLVSGGANNQIVLGAGSAAVTIGPTIITGAGGGDIIVPAAKGLRYVDAAGTGTRSLITGTNSSGINLIFIGVTPDIIGLGSPVSLSSASAGDVVIGNSRVLRASNAAGTAARALIHYDTSDRVIINGDNIGPTGFGQPASFGGASAGDVVLAHNRGVRGTNAAGGGTLRLVDSTSYTGTNAVALAGDGSSIVVVGNVPVVTNATAGDLVLLNAKSLRGVNAAGTGTQALIQFNSSGEVFLAPEGNTIRWGTAHVALGGGAAPTLGTIGGSGPSTAAQNSWEKIIRADGTTAYFPIWT